MKNHRFTILLGAVVATALLAIYFATGEPKVDGRTLSEWLYVEPDVVVVNFSPALTNAVRKFGPDAVPILLRKLQTRDSPWKRRLDNYWGRKVFPARWFNASMQDRSEAILGFSMLEPHVAALAVPELSRMLFDTNAESAGCYMLGHAGAAAFPALTEAMTNQNDLIRFRALTGLGLSPEGRRLSLPAILELRHRTNDWPVGGILMRLTQSMSDDETLHVLNAYAEVPRWRTSRYFLYALGNVRTNTTLALPLIEPFLTSPDLVLRMQATNMLARWRPTIAYTVKMTNSIPALRLKDP